MAGSDLRGARDSRRFGLLRPVSPSSTEFATEPPAGWAPTPDDDDDNVDDAAIETAVPDGWVGGNDGGTTVLAEGALTVVTRAGNNTAAVDGRIDDSAATVPPASDTTTAAATLAPPPPTHSRKLMVLAAWSDEVLPAPSSSFPSTGPTTRCCVRLSPLLCTAAPRSSTSLAAEDSRVTCTSDASRLDSPEPARGGVASSCAQTCITRRMTAHSHPQKAYNRCY